MKKRLILITLLLGILLVACVKVPGNQNNPPTNQIEAESSKQVQGLLRDRYIENDRKYLEVEVNDQVLKINATGYEDFGLLQPGSVLDLAYKTTSLELISVEVVENLSEENLEEDPEEKLPEEKKIYLGERVNLDGLNEYSALDLSFFSEYAIDSVMIYTDAEKVDNEFLFDDGNTFVVVAHSLEGDYELFNKRVQLGDIKVNIYTENDEKLVISLLESQTAGISFTTFEKTNEDYFVEINHYQGQDNINMLGAI